MLGSILDSSEKTSCKTARLSKFWGESVEESDINGEMSEMEESDVNGEMEEMEEMEEMGEMGEMGDKIVINQNPEILLGGVNFLLILNKYKQI